MDYKEFYDLAEYANENWKGTYTQKEVACNAYSYLTDFEFSMESGSPTEIISELYRKVKEDDSEECKLWAAKMEEKIPMLKLICNKFGLALMVKPEIKGLKMWEISSLLDKLDGNEYYPVEIQVPVLGLYAMGFMTPEFAMNINYDPEESELNDFVADILRKREKQKSIFSFDGNMFYMNLEEV